ncbi:MAG: FAD-binding oxidoreductase [Pseudomonadota bacterium]
MTQISRLPKDTGPAGWNALLTEPPPASPLDGDITADWLVIGGGLAGLAAARQLLKLRASDRVVLLEASRIGDGPAGRNSGFMIDLPHDLQSEDYGGNAEKDQRQIAQNRAAIEFAAEAVEEFGIPAESFDRWGKVNGAATASGVKHNEQFAAHLASMNEPYEMFDQKAMKDLTGTDFYLSGLYTPGTVLLQPAMYVRGLAEGMRRNSGLVVHENSPVVSLDKLGKDWRAKTPKGSISTPRIILAVNGHAQSFGFYEQRLMHVFTYASMTRALTDDEIKRLSGAPKWGATPADPMGTTVRRISGTGGDRVLVRNRFTFDPSMEISEARTERVGRDHDKSFKARFPMLDGVEMEHRWGGRLCLSLNGVSAFGQVDDGIYSACCQNGLGTTKGTLSGMCAADLAAQGNSPFVAELQSEDAPKKLPMAPIAQIGATLTLRWKEWRAGKEL